MTDTQLIALFFAQVAFILLVCRLVGLAASRFGRSQVVAEMVAGFLIGPSFFGWLAPGTTLMAGPLFSFVSGREPVPAPNSHLRFDAPA